MNQLQNKNFLLRAMNLISVKGRRAMAIAGKAKGRALKDGIFMKWMSSNETWQSSGQANKDLQEVNNVDMFERKSLKNLAVTNLNGMICLSSWISAQHIYGNQFWVQLVAMPIHKLLAF